MSVLSSKRTIAGLLIAGIALVVVAVVLAWPNSPNSDGKVTGQVVDVKPQSIDTFESLTIRDSSGVLWTFGTARVPNFTPSHLVQHQATGQGVTVYYNRESDGSVSVVTISDAP